MTNNKLFLLCLGVFTFSFHSVQAADYSLSSPDKQLTVKLNIDNGTTYELFHGETKLVSSSEIGMNLSDGRVIGGGTVKKVTPNSINTKVEVLIGKNKTIAEAYNELNIEFNENYSLLVRAYNEGIAYRFITAINGEIIVNSEDFVFNLAKMARVYFPECDTRTTNETGKDGKIYAIHQGFRNFERAYKTYEMPRLITDDKFSVTPVLFEVTNSPYKIVVTEADTYDYPGMYMQRNTQGSNSSMRGMWAKYPRVVMDPDDYYSNHLVSQRENYIAKTNGNRAFPWRVIIATNDDKSLLNNELVYLLAEPCRLEDTSWIQPGKSAWEWWHKAMLENVPFPVGNRNLSIPMYKYYIDWAAKNGLEYMTFDAGYEESWLPELCRYGKEKNVKIIVWTWASCVRENPSDWLRKMKVYGVSGVKVDFFERNDQVAMRWGYEFAQRLADLKMVGIFHGCPVPAGLNRTYPNILNFEAVKGGEDNFWRSEVTPNYHTLIPFIRSIAGPEDYTPGSLRNTTQSAFRPIDRDNTPPMSMGTRAHELAMYLVFDQWLGYLCDSPTEYNKFPDILDFLSSVPVVWDKTVPLKAELGKYILIAKQTKNDWYVGGMSNWDARNIKVDFNFLPSGVEYEAMIIRDANNSSDQPTQYVCETRTITAQSVIDFDMAKGGGFVIRLINPNPTAIHPVSIQKNVSIQVDKVARQLHVLGTQAYNSFRIYDFSGKQVLGKKYSGDTNIETIDLSGLEKGIYIINLQKNNETISLKFYY